MVARQSIASKGDRQISQAKNLIKSVRIAPSQKARMERIEGISAPVIASTARVDINKRIVKKNGDVVNVANIQAGEKFLLVQSGKFTGWFYIVAWTSEGIGACSCGKPNGCVHISAACDFTKSYRAPTPVKVAQTTTPPVDMTTEYQHAEEMLDLMKLSVQQLKERRLEGERKQKELSRIAKEEHRAKLAAIRQADREAAMQPANPYANWTQDPNIIGSKAWFAKQDAGKIEAARIREELTRTTVDAILADVNADLGRPLVRRCTPYMEEVVAA